jgi:hypothetical protein
MSNGWTPERRKRQAQMIRRWRPWERSTGPRTPEGHAPSVGRHVKLTPLTRAEVGMDEVIGQAPQDGLVWGDTGDAHA